MMTKNKTLAVFTSIVLMMGATSAFADSVQMTLSSGGTTIVITDNGVGDSQPALGDISFNGMIGKWVLNTTTGTQDGSANYIDLNSVDNSKKGAAPLTIWFSSIGNTVPSGLWTTAYAPTIKGGTVVFTSYYDSDNLYNGTAHVLSGPFTCAVGACAFNSTNMLTSKTPYSLTEKIVITPNNSNTPVGYSGDGSLNPPVSAPEPSSLLLMGAGLAGLALFGSRRKFTVN
jgi:hypothetical protein